MAGITDPTPDWTYTNAALLNDITSGSDGTCPSGQSVICTAATGWDGPTGNGSIDGDVVIGGPGIGGSDTTGVNATDATFIGGVHPNGQPTSYHWLYWPSGQSASTGTETSPATISGSTLEPVSSSVCTLTPATTYDYELVAANTSGSEIGYQGSFATSATESIPSVSSAAAISGSALTGQTLTGQVAFSDPICNSMTSYQWQESRSSSGPWATVGTAQTFALTSADLGEYVRFVASESNAAGPGTSTSPVIGPVTAPVPTTPPSNGSSTTTATTTTLTTSSRPAPTTTQTIRFYRCAHACGLINTHGASTYRPRRADFGHYIKIVTTLTRTTQTAHVTTRWVGPVTSPTAGSLSIGSGARAAASLGVRASTHKLLALVRIAKRTNRSATLVVSRQGRIAARVWAFVIQKGAVVSCTVAHALGRPVNLRLALKAGQTVKLVAVRT